MAFSPLEQALCRRLMGGSEGLTKELVSTARRHRVHYLLAAAPGPPSDDNVLAALRRELRQEAALDAWRAQDLTALLDATAAAGIDVLILKGTALAHMIYEAPHLRPRVDTDLLIRREHLEPAERVLSAHGWTHPVENAFELAAAQRHYVKEGPAAGTLHLDVHWRIANPGVFANALSFEDLWSRAVPIPALGTSAHAPSAVDALLLACLHRVAHHDDELDLLWLWDIHLLTSRLSPQDRAAFVALAARTAMTGVCARGLDLVADAFDTPAAADLAAAVRAAGHGAAEPSSHFIGGARPITTLRADLGAVRGWRQRVSLVAEHLLPSRAYMRARYPGWPEFLLPLAYLDRVTRGAPKWFRRSRPLADAQPNRD